MGHIVWSMSRLANILQHWQENKFDGIIVFDGRRGLGKSTGAVKLGCHFKSFKIKKDVLFAREDIMKHLATKKYSIIIADEMINVTHNRDFFAEDQKRLIKMLNMYRDSCNLLIACVPNFYDLDKQFRGLVKLRINVVRRGFAVLHTPTQASYSSDPWDLKINEKIERSWIKKNIHTPNYSRLTTYRGVIKYGDLRCRQREIYEAVKQEKRGHVFAKEAEVEEKKENDIYQKIFVRITEGGLNMDGIKEICTVTGMKWATVRDALTRLMKENYGQHMTMKKFFASPNNFLSQSLPLIKSQDGNHHIVPSIH